MVYNRSYNQIYKATDPIETDKTFSKSHALINNSRIFGEEISVRLVLFVVIKRALSLLYSACNELDRNIY